MRSAETSAVTMVVSAKQTSTWPKAGPKVIEIGLRWLKPLPEVRTPSSRACREKFVCMKFF